MNRLIENFEKLSAQVPITDEEAKAVVSAAGIDADKTLEVTVGRMIDMLDRRKANRILVRWEKNRASSTETLNAIVAAIQDARNEGTLIALREAERKDPKS